MTFDLKTVFSEYKECSLYRAFYFNNGHVFIGIQNDDGPIADLTVNIDGINSYPSNCSAVDTNNFPYAEGLIKRLGIGKPIGNGKSGFCTYPIYEFDFNAVDRYI